MNPETNTTTTTEKKPRATSPTVVAKQLRKAVDRVNELTGKAKGAGLSVAMDLTAEGGLEMEPIVMVVE